MAFKECCTEWGSQIDGVLKFCMRKDRNQWNARKGGCRHCFSCCVAGVWERFNCLRDVGSLTPDSSRGKKLLIEELVLLMSPVEGPAPLRIDGGITKRDISGLEEKVSGFWIATKIDAWKCRVNDTQTSKQWKLL